MCLLWCFVSVIVCVVCFWCVFIRVLCTVGPKQVWPSYKQKKRKEQTTKEELQMFSTQITDQGKHQHRKIKAIKTDPVALVVFVLFYIKLPSTLSFHIYTHTYTSTEAHSHTVIQANHWDAPLTGLNSRPHQISGHSQTSDLTFLLWFKDVSNNEPASSA